MDGKSQGTYRTRKRRSSRELQMVHKFFIFVREFVEQETMGSEVLVNRFACDKLEKLAIV